MKKELLAKLKLEKKKCSSIIVSIDKDLNMTAGWHYNPIKDETYFVEYFDGLKWFYEQLLQGDSTDNIPGIKRIGKVGAKKMLFECTTVKQMEDIVYAKYREQYDHDGLKYMIEVGQLLWMRVQENQMWYPEFHGGCKIE